MQLLYKPIDDKSIKNSEFYDVISFFSKKENALKFAKQKKNATVVEYKDKLGVSFYLYGLKNGDRFVQGALSPLLDPPYHTYKLTKPNVTFCLLSREIPEDVKPYLSQIPYEELPSEADNLWAEISSVNKYLNIDAVVSPQILYGFLFGDPWGKRPFIFGPTSSERKHEGVTLIHPGSTFGVQPIAECYLLYYNRLFTWINERICEGTFKEVAMYLNQVLDYENIEVQKLMMESIIRLLKDAS